MLREAYRRVDAWWRRRVEGRGVLATVGVFVVTLVAVYGLDKAGYSPLDDLVFVGGFGVTLWTAYIYDSYFCDCGKRIQPVANFCAKCGRAHTDDLPATWMADETEPGRHRVTPGGGDR